MQTNGKKAINKENEDEEVIINKTKNISCGQKRTHSDHETEPEDEKNRKLDQTEAVENKSETEAIVQKIFFIFDLETNGRASNINQSYKITDNWPNTVQICWGLYNENGIAINFQDHIIKPKGFEISKTSENIHGISNSVADAKGVEWNNILDILEEDLKRCDFIVAHNLRFDKNTILAEFVRFKRNDLVALFNSKKHICTMLQTENICGKWLKLKELYKMLFNKKMENEHDAQYDVKNLASCFFELMKLWGI